MFATERPLEVWAGFECTVCRIGDAYLDQLELTGHASRIEDIDRMAALGVRALRYPVLWERAAREPADARFRWTDERLGRVRELGMRPLVGLLHHGSGPPTTHLLDPAFPELFADYAEECAARYPWVVDWAPINEPLTTARFSALYGHWFPHARDDRSFVRALLNQCLATSRAMARVRRIIPGARLLQTEDLGRTHSSDALAGQAAFENERRWLSFDLLTGRINVEHPLWGYLMDNGADRAALEDLYENPCPPDVLGLNYYVSSERYLDHRAGAYPPHVYGERGYADVEAVQVCRMVGPQRLLEGAWARYRIPLAITEVQLACSREEQLRWLDAAWRAAQGARARGVDVRAVTAWATLGAFDWDSLLTEHRGHYEPGLFDVRDAQPRPTALAGAVRELSSGTPISHPVVRAPGWWERPSRRRYPADPTLEDEALPLELPPLLVIGRTDALGRAFEDVCDVRGLRCALIPVRELSGCDEVSVRRLVGRVRPWAVVDTACVLARAARNLRVPLLIFAADDGRRRLAAEAAARTCGNQALIVRAALAAHPDAFAPALAPGRAEDATAFPRCLPDLIFASLDLLIDGETGVWDLTNRGSEKWYALRANAATHAAAAPPFGAALPEDALESERTAALPPGAEGPP